MASIREMASLEGVFPCPEGASTLAGLKRLLQEEAIDRDGTILLLNTGSGYKNLDLLS